MICIAFLPIALHCSGVLYYIYNRIYISYNVPFNFILIHLAFNRRWSCVFHPGNLVLRFPVPRFQSPSGEPSDRVRLKSRTPFVLVCDANRAQCLSSGGVS